jgi:hypothetical protein
MVITTARPYERETDMPDYFDTGFTVRQPAWHGQGLVLDEHPTNWADARVSAGLTWEPEAAPSWVRKPTGDLKCMGCAAPYVIGGSTGIPHTPNCTEYLDHLRAYRTQDSYLGRSILSGDKAKAHALTLVREYAGV